MPPKIKQGYMQIPQDDIKKTEIDEKENLRLHPVRKKIKSNKGPAEIRLNKKLDNLDETSLTPKIKPLGFWSKKLQDLEENETKNKKNKLYEFSETDESETSFKVKKKQKSKARTQKKRQIVIPKYNKLVAKNKKMLETQKNMKLVSTKAHTKTNVSETKEEKLADKTKKLFYCSDAQFLGITSTPTVNKKNLIGASDFLFLSPISKEKPELSNSIVESTPLKPKAVGKPVINSDQENQKAKTKLLKNSCRRVLRNGKVIDL